MKGCGLALILTLFSGVAAAQQVTCDLGSYKAVTGVTAEQSGGVVSLTWRGESNEDLRARLGVRDGQPMVTELAARKAGGQWMVLGKDLTPEFQVTTGMRRLSRTQQQALKRFGIDIPEQENARKWDTFWDAPLVVPGGTDERKGDSEPLPRSPDEVRKGSSSYATKTCSVTTDGDQVSVTYNGLTLGIFAGDLRFTVYKGSNLLRQEAIAKTEEPSVAFIYKAGLKGFQMQGDTKLAWEDTARGWQEEKFGGEPNQNPVNLRARNRLEILDVGEGSLAIFPSPHKFFFAREDGVNLGYVYYRKDNNSSFSLGVMQPEHGEGYEPWGVSDQEYAKTESESRAFVDNYALYNAPPGTEQHMAVYYYLSPRGERSTQESVLAYTHDDVYKPVPGFKVLTGHYHQRMNEALRDRDDMDYRISSMDVFRNLGINIVYLGDEFPGTQGGPNRFIEQKAYFEGSARSSDKDFLVIPAEEVNSFFGGHWYLLTPKPIYFSHANTPSANQPFEENDPTYGHVYHLGSAEDVLKFANQEKGIIWVTHPRTKSSEGYPEAYKDKDFFLSDRFIGAAWTSLPADLSQPELCQVRCFGTLDDMSNWTQNPKSLIAEGDTYTSYASYGMYEQLAVNYIKLDRVPLYNESWAPIVEGIRAGNFFGTTGEVLFHNWGVEGKGAQSFYTASIEYTFPLQIAELVWSDGTTVSRKTISLTDTTPFGTRSFRIPFDATGKKWIRFSVWDSAGNGAYVQPIQLK